MSGVSKDFQISPRGVKRLAIFALLGFFVSNAYITSATNDCVNTQFVLAINVLYLCLSAAFVLLPRAPQILVSESPVRMSPRFWGFIVDFFVGIMLTNAIWYFLNLTIPTSQQVLLKAVDIATGLAAYALPFFISWVAFKKNAQTPGQYMMRFKVIPLAGETPKFGNRGLYLPLLMFSINAKDGILITDRKSNSRTVSTRT